MTNLLRVLPELDLRPYSHILPSLEKALVSTGDLLTLSPVDVAKRAQVPSGEVKKLIDNVIERLQPKDDPEENNVNEGQPDDSPPKQRDATPIKTISTMDAVIDASLSGGICPGYLTEVVGESAAGKTQFLITLLLAVQLPPPHGLGKSALYISTEAPLPTTRLAQILNSHPRLATLAEEDKPTLARVHSTHVHDLEAQDHILRYQVPIIVDRHDIGVVIIDSVAANYRSEFGKTETGAAQTGAASFAQRSTQLVHFGAMLRSLAQNKNLAVVVANQVADRFQPTNGSHSRHNTQMSQQLSRPDSSHMSRNPATPAQPTFVPLLSTDDPLSLDHQQAFTTGWGDDPTPMNFPPPNLKTPSLGLTWTNQLATRIALHKEPIYEDRIYAPGEERAVKGWKRRMKTVFCAWGKEDSCNYEVVGAGIRAVEVVEGR